MACFAVAPGTLSFTVAFGFAPRLSALRMPAAAFFENVTFSVTFWPAATCLRATFDLNVLRPALTDATASQTPATVAVQPTLSVPRKRCFFAPDGTSEATTGGGGGWTLSSTFSVGLTTTTSSLGTKRAVAGSAGPQSGCVAPGWMTVEDFSAAHSAVWYFVNVRTSTPFAEPNAIEFESGDHDGSWNFASGSVVSQACCGLLHGAPT